MRDQFNYRLKINNEKLEQVSVFKYFGIKLATNLHFSEHIDYIIGKSVQKPAVIHRSRESISAADKRQ